MCGLKLILLLRSCRIDSNRSIVCATGKRTQKNEIDTGIRCALCRRGPDASTTFTCIHETYQIFLTATLLQVRGTSAASSPLVVDEANILAFNGEIYSGLASHYMGQRDSELLFKELTAAATTAQKIDVLSRLRGPWALLYYEKNSGRILLGKDPLGRKSLLVHLPDRHDSRFLVSSSGPTTGMQNRNDYWLEMPCGIFEIDLNIHGNSRVLFEQKAGSRREFQFSKISGFFPWCTPLARQPSSTMRTSLDTKESDLATFMYLLDRSTRQRIRLQEYVRYNGMNVPKQPAAVLVLFSGGVDSTTLAALAHRHVPSTEIIDVCSVCFQRGRSPDRAASIAAFDEILSLTPTRTWRFIVVDVTVDQASGALPHVKRLIHPQKSKMDENIGLALWFAIRAKGHATLYGPQGLTHEGEYVSKARVALLGHGADELLGGYARHRAAYKCGKLESLSIELNLDMARLWIRNLGRDDRIISDSQREGRFPYLDEELMDFVSRAKLQHVMNLDYPPGEGDKMILRRTAMHLGLSTASQRTKCALQYGSRVSQLEEQLSRHAVNG